MRRAWLPRFRLAVDRSLFSVLVRECLHTLFAWRRRRGRGLGIGHGATGTVAFVQRFGGRLNKTYVSAFKTALFNHSAISPRSYILLDGNGLGDRWQSGARKTNVTSLLLTEFSHQGVFFLTFGWKKDYRDLLGPIGYFPRAEYEERYYQAQEIPAEAAGVK